MFLISPTTEFYFKRYHYLEVGELLSVAKCTNIVTEVQTLPYQGKPRDRQGLSSPRWYAAPPAEKILDSLTGIVSKLIGTELFPTYSYVRKYLPGDVLKKHFDLFSGEISVSIKLAESRDSKWPIIIPSYEDSHSTRLVFQKPGDALILQGCVVPHWRDEFITESNEDWQYQGLFLYVNANGPHADIKYNRREKLNY